MNLYRTRPLLGEGGLDVTIEGLDYMNDDPSDVDVLYGKVQEHSGRLQVFLITFVKDKAESQPLRIHPFRKLLTK